MPQDSSRPDFWDARFDAGLTPWDAGGTPPALARWLVKNPSPLRVLVPGCGAGHEVRAFHERGHAVRGIDFSEAALDAARRALGPLAYLVEKADVFEVAGTWDLVYERAFLCALPRVRWPAWGRAMARLVRPGGRLAGFFYLDDNDKGPPFGTDPGTLDVLLTPAFRLSVSCPVPAQESLPVFRGRERWQVWERQL